MDWTQALDLGLALKNVKTDMIGDWHRDPWGWPEFDFLVEGGIGHLIARLDNMESSVSAMRVSVAKENFGVRPAIIMDPVDRLGYQAIVDALSKDLIGSLDRSVHGWRLHFDDPKKGVYSRNDYQWDSYRKRMLTLASSYGAGLSTDVTACFSSINVSRLCEDVLAVARGNRLATRLVAFLHRFDGMLGRAGLPQRSMASAVLANFYLRCIDRELRLILDPWPEHPNDRVQVSS